MFVYSLARTPVVSRLSIHATNMSKWNKHFSKWIIIVMNYCYFFIYCSKLCIHIYCYLLSLDILLVLDMGGVLMAVEPVEEDIWYFCRNQDSTLWSCENVSLSLWCETTLLLLVMAYGLGQKFGVLTYNLQFYCRFILTFFYQ